MGRKKVLFSFIVVAIVFLLSLGALSAPSYLNETGFPIVKEPLTIGMLVGQAANHPSFDDLLVYQEYEKQTGIKVKWDMIPTNVLTEKRNLILTSGEYPDAFHSARFNAQDLMMYGEQGIFVPLNDLIEQYAPNIKQIFADDPDLKRGLTMPDGNIYSLPRIFDPAFTSVLAGWKLWINQDFLDALDMEEPSTLDELYLFLKAVKETDLNGNGVADEIPLGVRGDAVLFDILKGSFGLGNKGTSHQHVDLDPVTGELRFIPTSPEYRALLEYVHKLYSEGLITQDIYTVSSAEVAARAQDGVYGVMLTTNPITAYDQHQYIGLQTLEGPFGHRIYSNVKPSLVDIGAFVITDKNKHPEATMRWVDHFYGDEGAKLFFMGIEGITFETMPDGSVEFTDLINNNPDGMSFTQAVSTYIPYRNGAYPSIVKEAFFKGSEGHPASIEAASKISPCYPEVIWSPFSYTLDEMDIRASIGTDIDTYVKEMRAKFMIGQVPLSDWDKYVRTIERMGLDLFMSTYEAAYERYMAD